MKTIVLIPYIDLKDTNFPSEIALKISKESFKNIQFQNGKITFTIIGCDFNKINIENNENIDFKDISLQFVSCYINEININYIEANNISIFFLSSILSGRFDSRKLQSVTFSNCILNDSFSLLNQNSVDISYTEENIFPQSWKRLIQRNGISSFWETLDKKQSYYIHDSKKISFRTNLEENKKRGIYRRGYERLEAHKIGYYLNENQRELFNFNLNIKYSREIDDSETNISNSFLDSFSISGQANGKIIVENTKIQNWYIRDFSSQNETTFYNITPLKLAKSDSKFEIHKCNLDRTWFDNIDFSEYKIVSFYRTKFGKATFTSCNFPTDYTSFAKFKTLENVHYPERKSDNYYKSQYEIFLQLKIILESTGNFYESQKLQAISNDALKKIKQIPNWDKAILLINSKSNNHGLSIKQPLYYFFIFSISFYILYLFSLGRIFIFGKIDYSLFGYYFSFIDLTHRTDFLVNKEEFNFSSLAIDFLNKIISGFFIYQFISAFRKYGKK